MATIASTPRSQTFTAASASAGPYDLEFRLFSHESLQVFVNGVPTTDFTVSSDFSDGYDDAATLTFDVALSISDAVAIEPYPDVARPEDLQAGPNLTQKMNLEETRQMVSIADLFERSKRALSVAPGSSVTNPYMSVSAGALLVWADDGLSVSTTTSPTLTGLTVNGSITVTGTVDGRDVSADGSKLDGIETGATADQSGAEIKALYEAESDTNAFTDTEKSKLGTIETGATADQSGAEIKALYEGESDTNAFTDAEKVKLTALPIDPSTSNTGYDGRAALKAAKDAGATWDAGRVISDGTVQYLEMPVGHALYGTDPISDLAGLIPFPSGGFDAFIEHFVATSRTSAVNVTAGFQAAINYVGAIGTGVFGQGGKLGCLAREYVLADNDGDDIAILISNSMTIEGAGPNSTTFYINTTTDTTVYIAKGDTAAEAEAAILADTAGNVAVVDKVIFRGIQFYNQSSSAPTAGAHVKVDRSVAEFHECRFINHYRAVEFAGNPESCRMDNCDVTAGSNASSMQAGSACVAIVRRRVNAAVGGAYLDSVDGYYYMEPNSVYIDSCNLRPGASTSQHGAQNTIYIGACDGVYIQNSHIAWGSTACIGIYPQQANISLTDVRIDGGLIDPYPGKSTYGVYIADGDGVTPTTIGSVSVANTSIAGSDGDGVRITVDCNRFKMTGVDVKSCADYGLFVNDANVKNLSLSGCNFLNTNTDGGTAAAVYLDNCDRVQIMNCGFDGAYRGIQLTGNSDRVSIIGNVFDGITTGTSIFLPTGLTGKVTIYGNDIEESYIITAANRVQIPVGLDYVHFEGSTAMYEFRLDSPSSGYPGRRIIATFDDAPTLYDDAATPGGSVVPNFRIGSDFVAATGTVAEFIYAPEVEAGKFVLATTRANA